MTCEPYRLPPRPPVRGPTLTLQIRIGKFEMAQVFDVLDATTQLGAKVGGQAAGLLGRRDRQARQRSGKEGGEGGPRATALEAAQRRWRDVAHGQACLWRPVRPGYRPPSEGTKRMTVPGQEEG